MPLATFRVQASPRTDIFACRLGIKPSPQSKEDETTPLADDRRKLVGTVASLTVLAALLLVLLGIPPVSSGDAYARSGKPLILAPKAGATLPARPLTIELRTPQGSKLIAVRLNGKGIKRHLRHAPHGLRRLRVSPDHGLGYGRNRLTVKTKRRGGPTRVRKLRFEVRAGRPLAAAGRDRGVDAGDRLRLDGKRSLSHLALSKGAMPARKRDRLVHRWKLVGAPRGARGEDVLRGERTARPLFVAELPGSYRIRLTVRARDGRTGSDVVVVRVASTTPHIDAVAAALRDRNPGTEGKVWDVSEGNTLPDGRLLQTPDCWAPSGCGDGPLPPSAGPITARIKAMLAKAERSVELSGLWPPPDGPFREAIVEGLQETVAAGNRPTVRVILGTPPTQFSDAAFKSWFDSLVADAGGELPIQAAAMSTYRQIVPPVATSWNHSKVLAVDGRSAIVGGMNYWANDYMQVTDPANDVSITLDGPAATDAVGFENVLWGWICANRDSSLYVAMRTSNVEGCVAKAPLPPTPIGVGGGDDGVTVLTLGRLGNGIDVPGHAGEQSPPIPKAEVQGSACNAFQRQVSDTNTNREYEYRNPGEGGLRALIGSAEQSLFISQQDLLGCVYGVEAYFDERVFAALGEKIAEGVPITIVLSGVGAKAGGADYSNGWKPADVAAVLQKVVAKLKPKANARKLVCAGVGLAGVRTLEAATWPNGSPFANHAKVVWVDGEAFYVGSENLYPARLQELGMLIEDDEAAGTVAEEYLDPLWERSREGALIDPGRDVCGSF